MIRRRACAIVALLIFVITSSFFVLNFYFVSKLNLTRGSGYRISLPATTIASSNPLGDIKDRIVRNVNNLSPFYSVANKKLIPLIPELEGQFQHQLVQELPPEQLWAIANSWPKKNEVYPLSDSRLAAVIRGLQAAKLTKVEDIPRGTQLKLKLTLEGNQVVIFKPKWYDRDTVISGTVYSGKDRHNAEIFAFYLGALLELNWTPIVVGRAFNAKELYRLSEPRLKRTFLLNDSSCCFYGNCHYCNRSDLVCGHHLDNYAVEGVLLYFIPGQLERKRSPWQRTYKEGVAAAWESDLDYCEAHVKGRLSNERLLDLIDASIFDFLIQNGDRHHYETRQSRLLLLDNGKGFGNPRKDFLDILAPLYQCCRLRLSTYKRLLLFTGDKLTETIRRVSRTDLLHPILTDAHYEAVERRLLMVFSAVDICLKERGQSMFYP